MEQDKLNEILRRHKMWLNDEEGGESANLESANLRGADLDFSCLDLSCKTLKAKFDKKHIIQILYHAAMPCQNNKLDLDSDLIELLNSELFKKVVNKFHKVGEYGIFEGAK